jgi:hypothetical protein
MRKQSVQTFRGEIRNFTNVNTRTGTKMVRFEVNSYPFKAFGRQAEAIEHLAGLHAEITATHNTFRGKDEYAVVTVAGEIGGHIVTTVPGY